MMKTNGTKNTITFPDDEDRSTSQTIFNDIIEAAQNCWCPLDPIPSHFQFMGHMKAWRGERSLRVILSYEAISKLIRLSVIVADHVKETPGIFHDMIYRATAAYPKGKAIYDSNLRVVIAESNADRPIYKEGIPMVVRSIYKDFSNLLNDDCLRSALALSKARILGTPLDIWDRD
jgi:hypothetical protein